MTGSDGWIDVSRPLHPQMETFPGDPGITMELVHSRAAGDPADVTRLDMGAHTGTHVDAPVHFVDGGGGVETRPLDALEGQTTVVDARGGGELGPAVLDALPAGTARVLLRTGGATLGEEAAAAIADRGLRLVGVDQLSIGGPAAHRALFAGSVVVLEGLDLRDAPPGEYHLRCLPLLIPGADGAPARALLRPAAGAPR